MEATLTFELFRPSILDPVEDHGEARHAVAPGRARGTHPDEREPMGGGERRLSQASWSGGGPTLDDLVVGVWEGLSAHRTVACPACGGAMTPRYGAGPAPVGGRCRSCATTIA